jgi:hypothetical protein
LNRFTVEEGGAKFVPPLLFSAHLRTFRTLRTLRTRRT